jgi:hypothetical protein
MCDEAGVDQVEEEEDGVVAFSEGRTHIYMGDTDDIG